MSLEVCMKQFWSPVASAPTSRIRRVTCVAILLCVVLGYVYYFTRSVDVSSQHQPVDPFTASGSRHSTLGIDATRAYLKSRVIHRGTGDLKGDKCAETSQTVLEEWATSKNTSFQRHTSDGWPLFSKDYFQGPIPRSPYKRTDPFRWDFNTTAFLQRPDVQSQPVKLITWMIKPGYWPPLPEPVRMRMCPEMPCRLTSDRKLANTSAALVWVGQLMKESTPPNRTDPDQVFVFNNYEPQEHHWIYRPSFRQPAWKSVFNWTITYRSDSDLMDPYGYVIKRDNPLPVKNYTAILAKKSKMAAWLVSHCSTSGRREKYVKLLSKYIQVDVFGGCGPKRCPRSSDDACFNLFSSEYKFFLSFENAFCKDYVSEKFFRYLEADLVVVARGSNEYKNHSPPGIFINTADFSSAKDLADHLLYLDSHPEEYIKLLKAKDAYQPLYEDYPTRAKNGNIAYMHYQYEAVPFCELCRRLWNVDKFRKTVPDIVEWFDKGNCYPPKDIR